MHAAWPILYECSEADIAERVLDDRWVMQAEELAKDLQRHGRVEIFPRRSPKQTRLWLLRELRNAKVALRAEPRHVSRCGRSGEPRGQPRRGVHSGGEHVNRRRVHRRREILLCTAWMPQIVVVRKKHPRGSLVVSHVSLKHVTEAGVVLELRATATQPRHRTQHPSALEVAKHSFRCGANAVRFAATACVRRLLRGPTHEQGHSESLLLYRPQQPAQPIDTGVVVSRKVRRKKPD
mmetsp:Transcript_10429/g.27635  ORF Transcript_10429/g.27635 Transcript_10429/m.27635 type:complete len:236 (+) Transcript_10429:375-1082(+)